MKKFIRLLSLGIIGFSIVGCSCDTNKDTQYTIKNSHDVIDSRKDAVKLTTKEIYDYIRENDEEEVNKVFLKFLMNHVLDLENNTTNQQIYNLKLEKYLKEQYIDSDEYKVHGEFNEELFAASLEEQLYVVDRINKPTSGVTYDLNLKYNYSDFITRALDYDIMLEMLKGQYITEVKKSILDNSRTRIISVYSEENLDDMMELVEDLVGGEYETLEALTESKRNEEIEELGRQYCAELGLENEYYTPTGNCSPVTNNSTYDVTMKKFTTCANDVRCSLAEGLEYQVSLVREKEYIKEQVVNKNTTDILYEAALDQLFRGNVEDYLHEIIEGEDYFLADWLYNNSPEFSYRDIILTTGPDSTCYLVTVRVVDSETESIEDKEKALDLLLDQVSETTVLSHYLEDLNVVVKDSALKEYYNLIVGK